jgi:outer membrane protein TolC
MFRLCSFFILLASLLSQRAWAQRVDFDQVVQPVEAKARDFGEYLVQLAWQNHPESAIAYEEVANAREHGKNLRREWMRDAGATFNLNEGNIRAADTSQNIFFPRYNFGFNLNIFNIVSQPTKNKIAKHNITIAEHKVNQRKLEIRAETLQRYALFRMAKEILRTRSLAEQETYNGFVLMEQLYKTDEKNLDDYTSAAAAYFQAKENKVRSEAEVLTTKYRLEEFIGIRWEQIDHPSKDN